MPLSADPGDRPHDGWNLGQGEPDRLARQEGARIADADERPVEGDIDRTGGVAARGGRERAWRMKGKAARRAPVTDRRFAHDDGELLDQGLHQFRHMLRVIRQVPRCASRLCRERTEATQPMAYERRRSVRGDRVVGEFRDGGINRPPRHAQLGRHGASLRATFPQAP